MSLAHLYKSKSPNVVGKQKKVAQNVHSKLTTYATARCYCIYESEAFGNQTLMLSTLIF